MASPAFIRVRRAASSTLAGAAHLLGGAARAVSRAAESVRPGTVTADDIAGFYETRGRVEPRPQEPAAASPAGAETAVRARASASHVEELAARPAAEVIGRVGDLSTDDLRLLVEHELSHKRRKTVLAAIEKTVQDHAI